MIQAIRGNENSHFRLWPTPDASMGTGGRISATPPGTKRPSGAKKAITLNDAVKWATPTARDWKSGTGAQERIGHALPMSSQVGGQLNPTWVEWLIGWPEEWTDLKPLETDKFRSWQQQHLSILHAAVGG